MDRAEAGAPVALCPEHAALCDIQDPTIGDIPFGKEDRGQAGTSLCAIKNRIEAFGTDRGVASPQSFEIRLLLLGVNFAIHGGLGGGQWGGVRSAGSEYRESE